MLKINFLILTGGVVYNELFVDKIIEKVKFIADVYSYPGEMELEALAYGTLDVLTGKEKPKTY